MQRRYDSFWEGVPKGINLSKGLRPWSCSCGQLDNWLCRKRCWKCGRDQPARIATDAKRMAGRDDLRRDRSQSRGRSRERQPRGQDVSKRQGNGQSNGKSYADAAKRADELQKLQKQLAAEKRSREELERKLSAKTGTNPEATNEDDDDEDGDSEKREQRLRQLSAAIDALEAVVEDAEDAKLVALKSERSTLEKAKQAGKPLKAKLLALDRRIDKKKAALAKLQTETGEAWRDAEAARKRAEGLDEKQTELQKIIDELEADRKQMLREELDDEQRNGGNDGADKDTQHWEGTVEAIRARLSVPGVEGSLASAISATLEQLRQQCSLLPAHRPQTEPHQQSHQQAHQQHQQHPHPISDDSKSGLTAGPPVVLGPNGQVPSPVVGQRGGTAAARDKPPADPRGAEGSGGLASDGKNSMQGQAGGEEEEEEELREENGDEMAVDDVINLLPSRHRTRIREAIKKGEATDPGDDRTRRDRERSPRPTKLGEEKAH